MFGMAATAGGHINHPVFLQSLAMTRSIVLCTMSPQLAITIQYAAVTQARTALSLFEDVALGTRRALSPLSLYSDSAFLVLSWHTISRQFSWNSAGCGFLVAVTGSTWQLWNLRGCYKVYVASFQYGPRYVDPIPALYSRPRNCHVALVNAMMLSRSIPFREHCLTWLLRDSFAWRCDRGIIGMARQRWANAIRSRGWERKRGKGAPDDPRSPKVKTSTFTTLAKFTTVLSETTAICF